MSLTRLPHAVSQGLRVLGPWFRHRHHLVFSWLLVWHLVYGDRANLEDGLLYLVGDSTPKSKRGSKHPVAQKTRLSQHHPDVYGFRIVLLMAQWGVYRIPVDCALLRRKDDAAYQTENALFRQMLRAFRPSAWCQEISVVADAA